MDQLPPAVNILALRDAVVLPRLKLAFRIGREMSKLAFEDALASNKYLALFPQLDGHTETPMLDDLSPLGALAEIISHENIPNAQVRVVVDARKRISISKVLKTSPYYVIEPREAIESGSDDSIKLPPTEAIRKAVSLLVKYKPGIYLARTDLPYDGDPGHLADSLIQRSDTKFENQMACLLELNVRKRLNLAYEVIVKDSYEAQLENEINEQVTLNIRDAHRELFLRGQLKVILEQLGENAPISLHNPIFRGKSFKVDPRLLFVLMPFANEFRPIFSEIIKPVAEQFGLTCLRADDLYTSKAIMEDVWKLINEANLIIADVTGKNPNVFYETGLAHAIGKEVIIISQTIDDVPFDLRHLRCFIYKDSVAGFRALERQLYQALNLIDGLTKPTPPN